MPESVLISRQPVLDRELEVQAYRLVAHSSTVADVFRDLDDDRSAASVIHDAFMAMQVTVVTAGKPAHLVFSREMLLVGTATLLPPASTVVELGPDVGADDEVVAVADELRGLGFRIALAGVRAGDPRLGVIRADLAKVQIGPEAGVAIRQARQHALRVIAADVRDAAGYLSARSFEPDGYEGPFLAGPALVRGRRLDASRIQYLGLLRAVHQAELDFDDIEERIKRDVSLSWKFLNYANSAFFGWRERMTTIRHGLVQMGEAGIRRWVALVATSALADGLPAEVVTLAVTRARFAERIAESATTVELTPLHAYLAGMFSMLGALVAEPMSELVSQVAVPDDVASALLRQEGHLGVVLRLIEGFEEGDFETVEGQARVLGIGSPALMEAYTDALAWAPGSAQATPEDTQAASE